MLAEVMKFGCSACNTVCATKDDFVLQYVKQVWKGDFRAMSRETLLRAFTDKDRKKGRGAGITEELKEAEQMKWIGLMNNVKSAAEEIVLRELVCWIGD